MSFSFVVLSLLNQSSCYLNLIFPPFHNSAYMKSTSVAELQKKEQMIKKLAADLRKEREESRKKDVALHKYEEFYREVKARSAEKARQRQEEQRRLQQQQQLQQQR